jgi:cytochrome o ubiquinol oxidase subunit 3
MTTDAHEKTILGFWVYLLTDVMMFATIFATYLVLQNSSMANQIFDLEYATIETILLLCASFAAGAAGVMSHRGEKRKVYYLFGFTFFIGAIFFAMQMAEFHRLIQSGHGWQESGFLSMFFTLIGTHALHMVFALLWTLLLLFLLYRDGLTPTMITRLTCLRMFWQVLNVVWVFIFCIVYALGIYAK